jgi:GNAT superfamily N-acetyltransferase
VAEGSPGGAAPPAARLRLLLVEPAARGAGIGSRLVAECVRFARGSGYDRLTARTPPGSAAARVLERGGFAPVAGDLWVRPLVAAGAR